MSVSKLQVSHTTHTTMPNGSEPSQEPQIPASSPLDVGQTDSSMSDGMTLPIYPFATKRTQVTQNDEGAQHLILVLLTRDSLDSVKTWYQRKTRFSSVVDSGKKADRHITLSRTALSAHDAKLQDTVVIQPQADGSSQITLSVWRSI